MSFSRVIEILNSAVGGPDAEVGAHGAFWREITREEFIDKKIFDLALVQVGDGAHSNLVLALKGEAPFGSDLDGAPPEAQFPRMPAFLDPVSPHDIREIEQWIVDGCPEGSIGDEAAARAADT
jgi:hypothetical protein